MSRTRILGAVLPLLAVFFASLPAWAFEPNRADTDWIKPPALKPGDTIAFVAPAGPVDAAKVEQCKKRFERLGFLVLLPKNLQRKDRYLAGSDEERAREFNAAVKDKRVQAIFAVRGGYGVPRILDRIDYAAIRKNPKIIAGFSDITALHLAIAKKARVVTFHAPMPQAMLYRAEGAYAYADEVFWRVLRADKYAQNKGGFDIPLPASQRKPTCLVAGKATGRLIGGNLSLIAATVGTPFAIEAEGNILLLEDTHEAGYRVDRMLCQLRLAGVLRKCSGVVVGTFDGTDEKELESLFKEYLTPLGVPVIAHYPVGHSAFNATLPHGGRVELDANAVRVRLLEAPVRLE